jgi:hypothetical protein
MKLFTLIVSVLLASGCSVGVVDPEVDDSDSDTQDNLIEVPHTSGNSRACGNAYETFVVTAPDGTKYVKTIATPCNPYVRDTGRPPDKSAEEHSDRVNPSPEDEIANKVRF